MKCEYVQEQGDRWLLRRLCCIEFEFELFCRNGQTRYVALARRRWVRTMLNQLCHSQNIVKRTDIADENEQPACLELLPGWVGG